MPDHTLPQKKTCTKCGEAKPPEDFSPHKFTRDQRNSQCKTCSNAEQKSRFARRIRQCERCKQRKPSTSFPPHSRECSDCAPPRGFKRCGKCGLTKPLDDFYKDRNGRHGYGSKCKSCVGAATRSWATANSTRKKENEKRWREEHPKQVKALRQSWSKNNREKVRHSQKRSNERFPEKRQARIMVGHAIETGRLKKPDHCERCGKPDEQINGRSSLEGHHPDYSKPLEVKWLCTACHRKCHAAEQES